MKKITCLALTCLLPVLPVVAHAQSSVTLYGIVDTGIVLEDGGPKGFGVNMSSGIQDVSRWGITGREDLGGNVAAIFKLEDGILVNNGQGDTAGSAFSREAWVGMESNLGSLKAGLQFTPIYKILSPLTPFGNAFGGSPGQLMSGEKGGTRAPNQVIYDSPDFYGFKTELAYGFGNIAGSLAASRQVGASLTYKLGQLNLGYAYNDTNNATASDAARNHLFTVRYDFNLAVLHAGFGMNHGPTVTNSRDYLVGLSRRFATRHEIYLAYEYKDDLNGHFFNTSMGILDYTYTLSKRTNLYVAATALSNHRFATTKFGTGTRELDIGIRHKF